MLIKTKNEKLTYELEKTGEKLALARERIKDLEDQLDLKSNELLKLVNINSEKIQQVDTRKESIINQLTDLNRVKNKQYFIYLFSIKNNKLFILECLHRKGVS